jgi:hypothetical protein
MVYNTPASASTSHLRANQLCFRTHSTSVPTSLIFFNSGGGQTFVEKDCPNSPCPPMSSCGAR